MLFENITIIDEELEVRHNMYVGIKDDKSNCFFITASKTVKLIQFGKTEILFARRTGFIRAQHLNACGNGAQFFQRLLSRFVKLVHGDVNIKNGF